MSLLGYDKTGRRRGALRDRLATRLANLAMNALASPCQRDLARMNTRAERAEQVPEPLREAIQDALTCYAARFRDAPADGWPGVDSTLEGLAWAYRELTGWDADVEIEGEP